MVIRIISYSWNCRAKGSQQRAPWAVERMQLALDNGRLLLNRVERYPDRYSDIILDVGCTFAHNLHASICLMLAIQARKSATLASLSSAHKLLQVRPLQITIYWVEAEGRGGKLLIW